MILFNCSEDNNLMKGLILMSIQNVTVAGGGVLGSQIAYQTALHGFNVTLFDRSVDKAKTRVNALRDSYKRDLNLSDDEFDQGLSRITYTDNLADSVKNADLVIEAITESIPVKAKFYEELSSAAPEKTIFASNSSSLLPSQLVKYTDRPEKYLHFHFANEIWSRNTVEICGNDKTDSDVFNEMIDFAKKIGMIPVPLSKEQPGYVLNTMLIPWLNSSMILWAKGIADPITIDKVWMKDLGATVGPFGILDIIGLRTHYNIVKAEAERKNDDDLKLVAQKMKERIDANKLGPTTGEGFYHWPNPEFQSPDFLK